jgi:hypothetical protein
MGPVGAIEMSHLTKQEQLVLLTVIALLVLGWAVKTYRLSHPPTPSGIVAKP